MCFVCKVLIIVTTCRPRVLCSVMPLLQTPGHRCHQSFPGSMQQASLALVQDLPGDREEREEPPLQPGRGVAAAGRRRAVPPAERHGLRLMGRISL